MRLVVLPLLATLLASSVTSFVVPSRFTPSRAETPIGLSQPLWPLDKHRRSSPTQLQALPGFLDGAIQAVTSSSNAITSSPMFEFFLQTVISYAVPTFFALVTIFFAASSFRSKDDDDDSFSMDRNTAVAELYSDLYDDPSQTSSRSGFRFGGRSRGGLNKAQRRNLGIPSMEYLKITHVNERYDSYDFSLAKATKSKAYAASKYRSRSFDRALNLALSAGEEGDLPAYAKTFLLEAEQEFLKKGKALTGQLQSFEAKLAAEAMDAELKRMGMDKFEMDPEPDEEEDGVIDAEVVEGSNATATKNVSQTIQSRSPIKGRKKSNLLQSISKLQRELKQTELDFLQDVIAAVGPKRGVAIRAALLGDISARGTGGLLTQLEDRPLSTILQAADDKDGTLKKSLFVMSFPGDVQASQLNNLREEVTAIIRNAKAGDEALVVLQSGGGTVTGYGLAAGQLVRLKQAGLFLTMAVEQVAASGGYMMACVADRIVASPFAVLGSIGVISEIPNAYERLKQEGIEFQTVTAGKFKRTLTPTKKVTKADLDKSKEELEEVLAQFSGFVKENRPKLDIDAVATGETWFGRAALEKGLCDDIKTVDDVILNYVDLGYNVYEVEYSPPPEVPEGLAQLLPFGSVSGPSSSSWLRRGIRWAVNAMADEVRIAIDERTAVQQQYMAKDDTSDRVQMRD